MKQLELRSAPLHPGCFLSLQFQSRRSSFRCARDRLHTEEGGGEEDDGAETDSRRQRPGCHTIESNPHCETEADAHGRGLQTDGSASSSEFWSARRTKAQPDVALLDFFRREKEILLVVKVLKKDVWNQEMERSLASLPVTFDSLLVIQVLRIHIPCHILLKFFHWLKTLQHGFKHDEFTYSVMLNTLGRMGLLKEMQALLEEMKSSDAPCTITRVILSNVMLWFSKAKDMDSVSRHWKAVRHEGIKPSSAMYSVYIDYLIRTKKYIKVAVVFEEMLRVKCLPSSRTYTVFIKHLVDIGDFHCGSQILKLMQTVRISPNKVTYEILIHGFAKAQNVGMVLRLLNEMREHFHMPSKRLIAALKALPGPNKSSEPSLLILDKVRQEFENISMNEEDMVEEEDELEDGCSCSVWKNVTCTHVGFDINAFSQALHTWSPRVEEILDRSGMHWPYSLVFEILRRVRSLDSLWPFFHWLKDKAGFKHDAYTSVLMVRKILKSRASLGRKTTLVDGLFEGLKRDGMRFTTPLFNMVIRHYVCVGEAEKAHAIFKRIEEFGSEPNDVSYTLVIQGFARNRQEKKAMSLLRDMEANGFYLDSAACADLITCLGKAGNTELAYMIFNQFSERGGRHGPCDYKAIMEAYARAGDNGMALRLYDDMCSAGIVPSQDMYEVVTRVLRRAGRLSDLQMLMHERNMLDFFDGNNKALQETLLKVLFLFMESIKSKTRCSSQALPGIALPGIGTRTSGA